MIGAVGPTKFKWSHAREAATDIKLYIFFCECYLSRRGNARGETDGAELTTLETVMGAAIYVCNGGVTAFGARIVSSFGESLLSLSFLWLSLPLARLRLLLPHHYRDLDSRRGLHLRQHLHLLVALGQVQEHHDLLDPHFLHPRLRRLARHLAGFVATPRRSPVRIFPSPHIRRPLRPCTRILGRQRRRIDQEGHRRRRHLCWLQRRKVSCSLP